MNDVPLVKANNIHDINTSIIAIKKQLKQLNEAVGLIDLPTIDTSIFVKKSEVVDVVEEGNMNPVTSNAVAEVADSLEPVDEVTSGNMHSVTSNAVAEALNGDAWETIDGIEYKKIGNIVYLKIGNGVLYFPNIGTMAKSVSTENDLIIPEKYRPTREVNTFICWNSNDILFRLRITTTGAFVSWNLGSLSTLPIGSGNNNWQVEVSYCID